ncbi:hypothetical protein [Pontibacter oryzae]|uniref:Uncharacterized protein n=1 Tax=Pontibacter oryzae TaxID=2304593 RepID=A0A399RWG6_9BACT|nr:hypothetical protein [Pontibacter oryzae]RIJ34409.1 hypothetical protein D1627_15950 [Pontibacter oryzae]
MKRLNSIVKYSLLLCLAAATISCDNTRRVEGDEELTANSPNDQDTAVVVRSGESAEQELNEFREWLNRQADKGDTAIRKEWPQMKEDLRQKNAELERSFDSLSAKSKQEYRELQQRYKNWEARQERRQQQPLDRDKVTLWQEQLLREYSNINEISAAQMREAYLTFMGTVRTKRRSWTQDDWDYVDYVYSELNQRRRQLEGNLRVADNLKIRSLQAEYLALEGSADTKDMLQTK